jgi:tetratricopeptide (TPR) repeat protein
MTKEIKEMLELHKRLSGLRKQYQRNPVKGVPPGVELLKTLLAKAHGRIEQIPLITLLIHECSIFGMKDEVEELRWRQVQLEPEEPMPLIELASYYLNERNNIDKANELIDKAITLARDNGNYIRHAYNTRARIAKKSKDYKLLEDTLVCLINYKANTKSKDIAPEIDFLVNLPENVINEQVLKQYRDLVDHYRQFVKLKNQDKRMESGEDREKIGT